MVFQKFQTWRLRASRFLVGCILVAALFSAHSFPEDGVLDLVLECVGSLAIGACIVGRLWCAAHLSGQKNNRVVNEGPYSISRNPLYFFTMLGFLGTGLALESLTLAAAFLAVFLMTHIPIILREEKHLLGLFGAEYEAYCRRTPRLFPDIRKYASVPSVTFASEPFLRAAGDASLFLLVFPLAQVLEWLHTHGLVPVFWHIW